MLAFIEPAAPVLRSASPGGNEWLREVKFDAWRVQLHKYGKFAQLYTRGGHKAARRFSDLVAGAMPTKSDGVYSSGDDVERSLKKRPWSSCAGPRRGGGSAAGVLTACTASPWR